MDISFLKPLSYSHYRCCNLVGEEDSKGNARRKPALRKRIWRDLVSVLQARDAIFSQYNVIDNTMLENIEQKTVEMLLALTQADGTGA